MIKLISQEAVLPLRSLVLREGKPLKDCVLPSDSIENAFHLGYFSNHEIVSIASFLPSSHFENMGTGYQLRGMATHPDFGGKGYGSALIQFASEYLRTINTDYIWCNARVAAVPFYEKIGFEIQSEEFDIPGIGLHYEMKVNLK